MKVLVTGSRHWRDVNDDLAEALSFLKPTIIVHGAARGADKCASEYAQMWGIEERAYPAKWDLYGKAAGRNRNYEMLQKEHTPGEPIDLVLAFPLADSIGTYHMIRIAKEAGIPVKVFDDTTD